MFKLLSADVSPVVRSSDYCCNNKAVIFVLLKMILKNNMLIIRESVCDIIRFFYGKHVHSWDCDVPGIVMTPKFFRLRPSLV